MNMIVRCSLPEEAGTLSEIAYTAKAHWGYPKRWMEIWKPQLDFPPEYFEQNETWVAEVEGVPVAFYTLQDKNDNAWMENMWVRPKYIGKGVGKHLFLHALSRSRRKGYLILRLEADPNALGFYEKMGMYRVGGSNYPIEGQQRILPLMEIKL